MWLFIACLSASDFRGGETVASQLLCWERPVLLSWPSPRTQQRYEWKEKLVQFLALLAAHGGNQRNDQLWSRWFIIVRPIRIMNLNQLSISWPGIEGGSRFYSRSSRDSSTQVEDLREGNELTEEDKPRTNNNNIAINDNDTSYSYAPSRLLRIEI